MRRALLLAFVLLAVAPSAHAANPIEPYGKDDAGGFRNVLPPGTRGLDNFAQLAAFQATGDRPPHWTDQLPLYRDLVYASPRLRHADIPKYFKDATFGVRQNDVAAVETPRAGVRIVRDKRFGVPHVYGETRSDVLFGAGYAGAEDRLFLMDVLRHTGRAQLSSFAGGSASNRAMDRTQWGIAPYTEADLEQQIANAPKLYGKIGNKFVRDGQDYVDGVNAYIDEALLDPSKMPGEYAPLGQTLEHWKLTDVIATASLIGGIFGKGGGRELASAGVLQAFVDRFGVRAGRRSWLDFRSRSDPETPVTVRGRFRYENASPFSKRGLAMPDAGSVRYTPPAPPPSRAAARRKGAFDLQRSFARHHEMSNVLLVPGRESATGHPIAVMGPQVGYYVPQILMEEELHGPGFDAAGAAFPGVNAYVQLGHGSDYAWSATTAYADNVDTFAEVLCKDAFHYLWRGKCLAMQRLERTNAWHPNALDQTPPGSETLGAYRTVHGIVYARGRSGGRRVAFARARSTYMHEADSALAFSLLNDPRAVRGPRSFQRAVSNINFAFNWFYVDSRHIAYYLSGWYPQRARGTSPDFPILGTGQYDWRGYDPKLWVADWLPYRRHPNGVDGRILVNWNNRQAKGWNSADDNYRFGSEFRQELLADKVRRAIRGPRKARLEQLVQAMEESGTQDLRGVKVVPVLLRALGRPRSKELRDAAALLRRWHRRGGHRRDLDRDGHYDDDAAVTLMDAWWRKLVMAEFRPALGRNAFRKLAGFHPSSDPIGGAAAPPAFSTGWWGYVSKDLRTLFGKRPRGAYSRVYCGRGSRKRCRAALRGSLRRALRVKRADLYGRDETCADENRVEARCFDETRSTIAAGVDVPPFPWINRPTFQQTIELRRHLPR
ncbi:MAG TPA: penicillin acylase family protein [Thermoleophilaceae bacterium]|nr:penicillin acylase family protein [Thermoleophilaceae bacterium]